MLAERVLDQEEEIRAAVPCDIGPVLRCSVPAGEVWVSCLKYKFIFNSVPEFETVCRFINYVNIITLEI